MIVFYTTVSVKVITYCLQAFLTLWLHNFYFKSTNLLEFLS